MASQSNSARVVRDLHWSPGRGYLYKIGDEYFIVYTGESGEGWDACKSSPEGETSNVIVSRWSREDVVAELEFQFGQNTST